MNTATIGRMTRALALEHFAFEHLLEAERANHADHGADRQLPERAREDAGEERVRSAPSAARMPISRLRRATVNDISA